MYHDQNACIMSYMAQFPRQDDVGATRPRGVREALPPQRGVWGDYAPPKAAGEFGRLQAPQGRGTSLKREGIRDPPSKTDGSSLKRKGGGGGDRQPEGSFISVNHVIPLVAEGRAQTPPLPPFGLASE